MSIRRNPRPWDRLCHTARLNWHALTGTLKLVRLNWRTETWHTGTGARKLTNRNWRTETGAGNWRAKTGALGSFPLKSFSLEIVFDARNISYSPDLTLGILISSCLD